MAEGFYGKIKLNKRKYPHQSLSLKHTASQIDFREGRRLSAPFSTQKLCVRGIIGGFCKETCGDEPDQTTRADGSADVCWLCSSRLTRAEKGSRLSQELAGSTIPQRLRGYQMGGCSPTETPLITDVACVMQELVSHKAFSKIWGWPWMLKCWPLSQITWRGAATAGGSSGRGPATAAHASVTWR